MFIFCVPRNTFAAKMHSLSIIFLIQINVFDPFNYCIEKQEREEDSLLTDISFTYNIEINQHSFVHLKFLCL